MADRAALDGGIVEEELVVLRGDLAHDAPAAESVAGGGVKADQPRVHEVGALGEARVDLAHAGLGRLHLVEGKRQRYNLMGQPVGDDYHGIVIENGKKRIVK